MKQGKKPRYRNQNKKIIEDDLHNAQHSGGRGRKNKIEEIKKNVQKGTYAVESNEIAEKVVQRLKDKIFYKLTI